MNLILMEGPQAEPVTLAEAKLHLRVDGNEDDLLISSLITSAREYCETWQGRAYVSQTWELVLDRFPQDKNCIILPLPPLLSVESIKFKNRDGVQDTCGPENYIVDTVSQPGRIVPTYGKAWPSLTLQPANAITIRFTAGYGGAEAVPEKFKAAIKLIVAYLYEHRDEKLEKDFYPAFTVAEALLRPDKIIYF